MGSCMRCSTNGKRKLKIESAYEKIFQHEILTMGCWQRTAKVLQNLSFFVWQLITKCKRKKKGKKW